MTRDEAQELITRLLGTRNPIGLMEFEFGWLAEEELSEQERAAGMHVGQGCYVIDRTGIVTAQSSLPTPVIIQQYVAARREGRIKGYQVWPKEDQPD